MKIQRKLLYVVTGLIMTGLFMVSYMSWFNYDNVSRIYNISVIINEDNDIFWKNRRKGMDQAAAEFQVDINFITLYSNNSAAQQEEFIKREIENGTEAIVVSPADSEALAEILDNLVSSVPVIVVDSGVPSSKVNAYISADNKKMGQEIAAEAASSWREGGTVYILTDNLRRYGMKERYDGVVTLLEERGILSTQISQNEEEQTKEWLENLLKTGEDCVIICLDEKDLVITAEILGQQSIESKINLYGIGVSNQIVYYLENGWIQGILAPDYFSLGYLSIEKAISVVKKETIAKSITVESIMAYPHTIYHRENAIKLFPIT